VKIHRLAVAMALAASIASPLQTIADEDPSILDPRRSGESVSYRIDAERSGSKEPSSLHTQLSISLSATGLWISSTTPTDGVAGTRRANGEIVVAGKLQQVVEPFNEIQTALSGINARHQSSMTVLLGDSSAIVPVIATSVVAGNGDTTMTFAGQTDAAIKAFKAHLAVNVRAVFAGNRLLTASATNEVAVHVLFRTLRIQQTWTLARI
jgi:hypothetical protein